MRVRLLIAAPDTTSLDLYQRLLEAALAMLPLDVVAEQVSSAAALERRLAEARIDVVLLDWALAGPESLALISSLIEHHPHVRVVAILPLALPQYRVQLWKAGVCVGAPKENIDQEWLLSTLCLITRAMEREARARAELERILP
ncbi:MAG: hypothetical protein K1X39_12590 [Thermoflexales bacterium]|nr:hypothetical protein [Thermoflexales bacterium]